ncbi:MAG: SOS response-associated peptidase [Syntrophomonadaceae bacterium]|jgi:putative SOS response-associated peptidase YedK|nr:SOS response-associated peptidase [Syntrophomonadaceae bacterium]
MCGRFSIIDDIDQICQRFNCPTVAFDYWPRYNVAPTQEVPVVMQGQNRRELKPMRWGLIPYWTGEGKKGKPLINARVESIGEKPSFKNSFRHRRCIIPCNGYFEWQKEPGGKLPYRIMQQGVELFGLAGLWDQWMDATGQEILSFAIITTEAAEAVRAIHQRMPYILSREQEKMWLEGTGNHDLLSLMQPVQDLASYRVSTLVNSPKNDTPAIIEKIQ